MARNRRPLRHATLASPWAASLLVALGCVWALAPVGHTVMHQVGVRHSHPTGSLHQHSPATEEREAPQEKQASQEQQAPLDQHGRHAHHRYLHRYAHGGHDLHHEHQEHEDDGAHPHEPAAYRFDEPVVSAQPALTGDVANAPATRTPARSQSEHDPPANEAPESHGAPDTPDTPEAPVLLLLELGSLACIDAPDATAALIPTATPHAMWVSLDLPRRTLTAARPRGPPASSL